VPLNYTKIIPCFMGFHDITQLSARQQLGTKSSSGDQRSFGHHHRPESMCSIKELTKQRKEFEREKSHYVRI
jgi:hypothetical protein